MELTQAGLPKKTTTSSLISSVALPSHGLRPLKKAIGHNPYIKTLNHLISVLKAECFMLKRSSVYLRIFPQNARCPRGKDKTAPVKLLTSHNSLHKGHPSIRFAKSVMTHLQELVGILEPWDVSFQSQGDVKFP